MFLGHLRRTAQKRKTLVFLLGEGGGGGQGLGPGRCGVGGWWGGGGGGRVRGWGERAQARRILVNLAVICVVSKLYKTENCTKEKNIGCLRGGGKGRTKRCF